MMTTKKMLVLAGLTLGGAAFAEDMKAMPAGTATTTTTTTTTKTMEMPKPVMSAEGKRFVEGMRGKWKGEMAMTMGSATNKAKLVIDCDKAADGWATHCEVKATTKGMPDFKMEWLIGWSVADNEAHIVEASNMGEFHDLKGKWVDDKSVSVAFTGKGMMNTVETNTVAITWTSPKEIVLHSNGKSGTTVNWHSEATLKK